MGANSQAHASHDLKHHPVMRPTTKVLPEPEFSPSTTGLMNSPAPLAGSAHSAPMTTSVALPRAPKSRRTLEVEEGVLKVLAEMKASVALQLELRAAIDDFVAKQGQSCSTRCTTR